MSHTIFEIVSTGLAAVIVIGVGLIPSRPKTAMFLIVGATLGLLVGANIATAEGLPSYVTNLRETIAQMFSLHGEKLLRIGLTFVLLVFSWIVGGKLVDKPSETSIVDRSNRRYFPHR